MYDVLIIGAGVIGCAIAGELSKYQCDIAVVERESDVCEGTSKANSAIIHAGYDAIPGTLKARFNAKGNAMMTELSKRLDIPFKRDGSMVLCFDEKRISELEELKRRGLENGIEGLQILSRQEAVQIEPSLSDEVVAVLYAPTAGIVCPFEMTIAFAENSVMNGAKYYFNREVTGIRRESGYFDISTSAGNMQAKIVVNAAGVYADVIHNMVCEEKIHITPRRGEYCLMDKNAGALVSHTLFQLPGKFGKGILVTPTVHGNLLVGPTATDEDDREGVYTTGEGLAKVLKEGARSVSSFPNRQVITSFAGLRAHEDSGDFVLGEKADGFFDAAGIASPGLSCAPAIGEYIAGLVAAKLNAVSRCDYVAERKGIPHINTATKEEREALIAADSSFAKVVCRCELVTEGEIKAAIHRPLGAKTLDGIKRRTRAGMGRCQSGFCSPKVLEILAKELDKDISEITKCGEDSGFLIGYNKGGVR